MDPEIWGPVFWDLLFDIAHSNIPLTKAHLANKIKKFFNDTQYFLPCIGCRNHYCSYLKQCCSNEISSSCDDIGLYFLFPLKNSVNRRLEKKELPCEMYLERRKLFPVRGSLAAVQTLLAAIRRTLGASEALDSWCSDAIAIYSAIKTS